MIGNYKYVKYQTEPYYCSQNINRLSPKELITKWNKKIAYFFVANIQKFVSLYDFQQGGYKLEDIKEHKIYLPINNKIIDFDFLDSFIAELEAERIAELSTYLKVSGLYNYELSGEELKALQEYETIEWREYTLSEVFKVMTSKKRFDANKIRLSDKEGYPYVVRKSSNNGIKGYIKEDTVYLNDGNTISFGQDTATSFYQKEPYFTGDKIKILKSKVKGFNKDNALFFVTSITRSFSKFSWGNSSYSVDIIQNQRLSLPIINGNINFRYIELFTKAISKLIIKDIVEYVDNKIDSPDPIIKE